MFGKPLQDVTLADLRSLCANKAPESITLDFKQELPGTSDADKKDFLADVCAFANANGGTFVFGISETTSEDGEAGLAEELVGLDQVSRDEERRRLTEMLRSGIQPRLHRFAIEFLGGEEEPLAMLLEVERSWNAPHRVSYKKPQTSFPVRHGPQKAWMDVTELRDAFLRTEHLGERLRAFRKRRVEVVIGGEAPVHLLSTPAVIVHLVPFLSFEEPDRIDIRSAFESIRRGALQPMGRLVGEPYYNLDGVVRAYHPRRDEPATSYLQLFRSGVLESLSSHGVFTENDSRHFFNIREFDKQLFEFLERSITFLQGVDVAPPYSVMVSIVHGSGITAFRSWHHRDDHELLPLHTNQALVPEVLLEAPQLEDLPTAIRPVLDLVSQTFGLGQSDSYDQNGTWTPRP